MLPGFRPVRWADTPEAGRHQAIGRNALRDQEFDDGRSTGGRQFPVVPEAPYPRQLNIVRVAVHAQHPVDLRRNFLGKVEKGRREFRHLGLPFRVQVAAAGRKEHFRLEDETVADDADVFPIREDLPQPTEEVRTVAVELLDTLRQGDVQPAAEIGYLGLRGVVLRLGCLECTFDGGDLAAKRCDLLVQEFDLTHRPGADLPFVFEFRAKPADLFVCDFGTAGAPVEQSLQAGPLAFRL